MDDEYAFRAVYGNTVIKGHSFTAVADALIERGFDMTRVEPDGDGNLRVPHTTPRRRAALLSVVRNEPEPVVLSPEDQRIEQQMLAAYRAVYNGAVVPGIQTRACGAVHTEGAVCLIPVLFEALHCGCGDMVYPHEQPHEATDENGVRYRWEEVLMIQDLPYDSYGTTDEQVSA